MIEHFWQPDWFVGNPQFDPDECSFHEVESLYVEQTLGWPLDPIEASVSDPGESTSNPSPPSKEKPPEADPVPVRVVNATCDLKTQGKRVSLRAVCEKAGVDRTNFVRNYAEAAEMVKKIAAPDRQPVRGSKRNGAWRLAKTMIDLAARPFDPTTKIYFPCNSPHETHF